MNNNITRDNPIAAIFDETIASVSADETRPVQGFLEFVRHSAQFESFQRLALANLVKQNSPETLYAIVANAMQYGFESGKSYVISGRVDDMLALEDEAYTVRTRAMEGDPTQLEYERVITRRKPTAPEPPPSVDMKPGSAWIPISECLPDKDGWVIAYAPLLGGVQPWFCSGSNPLAGHVTYWMPLPAAPGVKA